MAPRLALRASPLVHRMRRTAICLGVSATERVGRESFSDFAGDSKNTCGANLNAPSSLTEIGIGTRLVLPSPNGSALAFGAAEAGASQVVAACIRNAAAVGAAFSDTDLVVGVVAAGERWRGATGPMRVALEDHLGAGAVLAGFDRDDLSPEARAAVAVWHDAEPDLRDRLHACASGRQLVDAGWADDVAIAAQAHVSDLVPTLDQDRFVDGQA